MSVRGPGDVLIRNEHAERVCCMLYVVCCVLYVVLFLNMRKKNPFYLSSECAMRFFSNLGLKSPTQPRLYQQLVSLPFWGQCIWLTFRFLECIAISHFSFDLYIVESFSSLSSSPFLPPLLSFLPPYHFQASIEIIWKPVTGQASMPQRADEQRLQHMVEGIVMCELHPRTTIQIVVQEVQ